MNKNIASTANQVKLYAVGTTAITVNDIYADGVRKRFSGKAASQNTHDALHCFIIGSKMG